MTIDHAAERPTYTPSEAARYAGFSTQSVARWRAGYTYPTQRGPRRSEPLTSGQTHGLLTFNELVEVAVVAAARRADVSMKSIRAALGVARDLYDVDRPLVTLRFKHDGKDIFIQEIERASEARYVNLSRHGQIAWDHIRDVLRDLDYEEDVAVRWWPVGRDTPIVIDPRVSFGRPYVASKGVSTDAIRSRFVARESIDDIVDDFDLTEEEVEAALRFELPAAA
ncbi:MAG: DUF433 domain-containing protein [Chloroflexota bacterium]